MWGSEYSSPLLYLKGISSTIYTIRQYGFGRLCTYDVFGNHLFMVPKAEGVKRKKKAEGVKGVKLLVLKVDRMVI